MSDGTKLETNEAPAQLPEALAEVDHLKLQVFVEKRRRLEMQLSLLQEELKTSTEAQRAFEQTLGAKYKLTPDASVNFETGKIIRK
jgi:hypothetical protein